MKYTCLSKGKGFYFPPCHILDISGFRVLLDCPMDLSALTIFSPIPTNSYSTDEGSFDLPLDFYSASQKIQKNAKSLDDMTLIKTEPWYKIPANLLIWDISFIDIVLISSPMGMLGLPFLSRMKGFSAKVYATEVTRRLGQLMMEDLLSMHAELRQVYGPEESDFPQWLRWEELELLPSTLREMTIGKDGNELGGWMPLYSADDVKLCIKKIDTLKYAEEACYNGTLIIKALGSGLDIGTCNWTINGPKRNIAILSSSVFVSACAMDFNYHALEGSDSVLFSDFSPTNTPEDVGDNHNQTTSRANDFLEYSIDNTVEESKRTILNTDENLEETDKLYFVTSCVIDSVKAGGSVLIPIGRLGVVLQLLEHISSCLDASDMKVPIYFISSVAEDLLAYTNIIPEWLCKQRQEKLFSCESLFAHADLIKEKKLHLFPAIHSSKLLKPQYERVTDDIAFEPDKMIPRSIWQEPCIIFCPHWSLRLGPAVHLLRRWGGDPNSLLVMEEGVNADIALLPFKPMAMKVLRGSFLPGLKSHKIQPLLNILQPKLVLFPEELKQQIAPTENQSFTLIYYSENKTLRIPSWKDTVELEIEANLVTTLQCKSSKQKSINAVRLKGDVVMNDGKHQILGGRKQLSSCTTKSLMHTGLPDPKRLVSALEDLGIRGSLERMKGNDFIVIIAEPNHALVEVKSTCTVISTGNGDLASLIFKAIDSVLDGL